MKLHVTVMINYDQIHSNWNYYLLFDFPFYDFHIKPIIFFSIYIHEDINIISDSYGIQINNFYICYLLLRTIILKKSRK